MSLLRRMMMQRSAGGSIIDNYLTIEALEDGLTAKLSTNAVEYCIDGSGLWVPLAANTETPAVNAGHTLSFRATLSPSSTEGVGVFTLTKKCNLLGNCMSLLFGDKAAEKKDMAPRAFYNLFKSCTSIVSVSENFLPATTLAENCYEYMFHSCSKLTTAPALPATTLVKSCYLYMFYRCSKLNYIKALFTTTPSYNYTQSWVYGVASKGTFVQSKDATWGVMNYNGVPKNWTVITE